MEQQVIDGCETLYSVDDFVKTPPFCVDALVASKHRPPPDVLDPFAGDGAILRRLVDHGWDRDRLHAVELRKSELDGLRQQGFGSITIGDWFEQRPCFAVSAAQLGVVMNVPWSILEHCVTSVLDVGFSYVASLQPLEELGGVDRAVWLNKYKPTALVSLKRRPFPKAARGVAWFIFDDTDPPMDFEVR